MPIYEHADSEVKERIDTLLTKFHGPLVDAGVTIDCLFAEANPDSAMRRAASHK